MQVEHWDETTDGPLTPAALRKKLEARGYSVSSYTYPPGCHFPPHTHEVDKIDAVVSGRFRITMRGQSVILEAGDAIAVPRGEEHEAEVIGNTPVVSLDAIRNQ